jgi:hypothetical protein
MTLNSIKQYALDVVARKKPVPFLGIGVFLVLIIVGWVAYHIHSLNAEIDRLHNQIETKDSLHVVAPGEYERLVQDFYTESELRKAAQDSNGILAKALKLKNGKIIELTALTIQMRSDSGHGKITKVTTDTINKSSHYEFKITSDDNFSTLYGWLDTNPYDVGGFFTFAPLDSTFIVLYEDTDGFINARVALDDRLASLTAFSVQRIKPTLPGDGWRFRTGIGAVKGFNGNSFGLGALIGVSYGSWGVSGIIVPNGIGGLLTKDF